MIKEKDMFDFRDNVRYQDGADVTIQTAQIALSNCAREHGVPVIFTLDQVKYGGLIGGSTNDCLVLYHPQHEKDYYKFAVEITHQGNYAFVSVRGFGVSRLMGNENAHNNMVEGVKAAFNKENEDTANAVGYAVGAVLGAGIRRVLPGGRRDKQALELEKNWYVMINDVFDEVFS